MGTAYGGALVVTAPASVLSRVVEIPPTVTGLAGTVWQGQAVVAGGIAAAWQVDIFGSLQSGALVADWTLTGADSRLSGRASGAPGRAEVTDVSGVAGWSLLAAAMTDLPAQCNLSARVEIEKAKLGPGVVSGRGKLTSPPMVCATEAGEISVPATTTTLTPIEGGVRLVAETREDGVRLGSVDLLARGWMIATLEPAGAQLIPGMPSSAATVVEMPLALTVLPPPAH